MSRPDVFDEYCDECNKLVNVSPDFEGVEIDGVWYCNDCFLGDDDEFLDDNIWDDDDDIFGY